MNKLGLHKLVEIELSLRSGRCTKQNSGCSSQCSAAQEGGRSGARRAARSRPVAAHSQHENWSRGQGAEQVVVPDGGGGAIARRSGT